MKVVNSLTGSTMTVDDEAAKNLGPEWGPEKPAAKKAPAKPAAKADAEK